MTDYPRCPACPPPAPPRDSESVRAEAYELITDLLKLEAVGLNRLRDVREDHTMTDDDILYEYQLKDERVDCSYGHPTKNGVVAKTQCGAMVFLGMDCATEHVAGFDFAEKRMKRTKAFAKNKATIANFPELQRRLSHVHDEVGPLFGLIKELGGQPFAKECHDRAKKREARLLEVEIPLDDGKVGRERLVGLELWDWSRSSRVVIRETLEKVQASLEEWRSFEQTPALASRLSKRYGDLEKECKRYEEFWDVLAENFFAERNIALAVYAVPGRRPKKDDVANIVARVRRQFESAKAERDGARRTRQGGT